MTAEQLVLLILGLIILVGLIVVYSGRSAAVSSGRQAPQAPLSIADIHADFESSVAEVTAAAREVLALSPPPPGDLLAAPHWKRLQLLKPQIGPIQEGIKEYWQALSHHPGKVVIALVGMVNAGKSTLGNLIIADPEARFTINSIRETAAATFVDWGSDAVVVDLPGIGSVCSKDDDEIARRVVRRADVIVLVIAVNESMPKAVYEFVINEVAGSQREQICLTVLNKTDIPYGGIPAEHREIELSRLRRTLLDGDKAIQAPGIGAHFDYELEVLPFSEVEYRRGDTRDYDRLISAIRATSGRVGTARSLLRTHRILNRAATELSPAVAIWKDAAEAVASSARDIEQRRATGTQKIRVYCVNEKGIVARLRSSIAAGEEEMLRVEKIVWLRAKAMEVSDHPKRDRLKAVRARLQERVSSNIDDFAESLELNLRNIVGGETGTPSRHTLPDVDSVLDAYENAVTAAWDRIDDINMYRKPDSDEKRAGVGRKINAAGAAMADWLVRCEQATVAALNSSLQVAATRHAALDSLTRALTNPCQRIGVQRDKLSNHPISRIEDRTLV